MIKEAYVSFEVAKLLKEKGFDELCDSYRSNSNSLNYYGNGFMYKNSDRVYGRDDIYSAPTHQIAIAWIVEKYNAFIEVSVLKHNCWVYTIYKILSNKVEELYNDGEFKSHEEAVESALKYYLTNLI